MDGTSRDAKLLFETVYNTVNAHSQQGSFLQGRDITYHLHDVWIKLVETYLKQAEWGLKNYQPPLDEYMVVAVPSSATEAVTLTQFFLGERITHEMFQSSNRTHLCQLTSTIGRMSNDIQTYQREAFENKSTYVTILQRNGCTEEEAIKKIRQVLNDHIEELVKEVHVHQAVLPRSVRQQHFNLS